MVRVVLVAFALLIGSLGWVERRARRSPRLATAA